MTDEQLLRYSRHILLDEIGVEGQQRIQGGHALLIGAGGLGSSAALFLGSSGVGRITVVDDDRVDLTNLQRQIAHNMARVGSPKAESIRTAIAELNPEVRVTPVLQRVDGGSLAQLVAAADVVLDCSDNYATRQAVNAACVQVKKPLVSGAAIRFDAQVAVFDTRDPESACYACVFDPREQFEEVACSTMGVFAPLVGIVGSLQAAEALKLLVGAGEPSANRLLLIDAKRMAFSEMRLARHPYCPVCGRKAG